MRIKGLEMTDGDRIDSIRERVEFLNGMWDGRLPLEDIEWLLDKLDEAHHMYYRLKEDNKLDQEEIYRLRDEVNALWDVVWSFVGEDSGEMDRVSAFFLERYNVHQDLRKGNFRIEDLI